MLEERALGLEDGITVFKGSLRFYPVVIRQVTIARGFFFWLQNKLIKMKKRTTPWTVDNGSNKILLETSLRNTRPLSYSLPICMGRLRVKLFSLENRTRELNLRTSTGTLAPWCIMVPDITWT